MKLTEQEWRELDEFRRDWYRFCDADPVAVDFTERMEAAGYIELAPATGDEMDGDPFWAQKWGPDKPSHVWKLTPAGRAAIKAAREQQ